MKGLFLLSLCENYREIFLARILCVGFGYSLAFVPCLALVSTYFDQKRSTAIAITITGSITGVLGLVFPAIAENMLLNVGFRWTIRTIAFVQMTLAIVAPILLKVGQGDTNVIMTTQLIRWTASSATAKV